LMASCSRCNGHRAQTVAISNDMAMLVAGENSAAAAAAVSAPAMMASRHWSAQRCCGVHSAWTPACTSKCCSFLRKCHDINGRQTVASASTHGHISRNAKGRAPALSPSEYTTGRPIHQQRRMSDAAARVMLAISHILNFYGHDTPYEHDATDLQYAD